MDNIDEIMFLIANEDGPHLAEDENMGDEAFIRSFEDTEYSDASY